MAAIIWSDRRRDANACAPSVTVGRPLVGREITPSAMA
jgi:hypothetical protein